MRQELREPKAKSSLLSIIRNAVDHRPDRPKADTAATLLFRELLKYSQRTVNDIDTAEEAWKRGIDDIRNNLLGTVIVSLLDFHADCS